MHHSLWSTTLWKISKIDVTRMVSDFKAKIHQIWFPLGLCPRPAGRAYSAPADLWLQEQGRGREKNEGMGRRKGVGKGMKGGKECRVFLYLQSFFDLWPPPPPKYITEYVIFCMKFLCYVKYKIRVYSLLILFLWLNFKPDALTIIFCLLCYTVIYDIPGCGLLRFMLALELRF